MTKQRKRGESALGEKSAGEEAKNNRWLCAARKAYACGVAYSMTHR